MQGAVSMGLFILAGVFFLKVAWNLTVPFELARRKDERAGEKGDRPQGFPMARKNGEFDFHGVELFAVHGKTTVLQAEAQGAGAAAGRRRKKSWGQPPKFDAFMTADRIVYLRQGGCRFSNPFFREWLLTQ